jgi:hypothetical protein
MLKNEVTNERLSSYEFSINVLSQSSGSLGRSECILDFPRPFDVKPRDELVKAHDGRVILQKIHSQSNSLILDRP